MSLEIRVLNDAPSDWDTRIRRYPGKTLFHESSWLRHVVSLDPSYRVTYLEILANSQTVGYMPIVGTAKAFLRIAGSPLPGTGTNYLGPVIDNGVSLAEVMAEVLKHLRRAGWAHVELAHRALDTIDHARLGVEVHKDATHVVPLPTQVDDAWNALKSTCRNRVRKAEKAGLRLELTQDPSISREFIERYAEVYGRQKLALPWGVERPKSLIEHLLPAGRLWLLRVWYRDTVVACGLFPFDERAVYFWGAASWTRYHELCPNEFLHWNVIRMAVEHGIVEYNMSGGHSQFKDKFGGTDIPYLRLSRSFIPGLRAARYLYARAHLLRLRLRGSLGSNGKKGETVGTGASST